MKLTDRSLKFTMLALALSFGAASCHQAPSQNSQAQSTAQSGAACFPGSGQPCGSQHGSGRTAGGRAPGTGFGASASGELPAGSAVQRSGVQSRAGGVCPGATSAFAGVRSAPDSRRGLHLDSGVLELWSRSAITGCRERGWRRHTWERSGLRDIGDIAMVDTLSTMVTGAVMWATTAA